MKAWADFPDAQWTRARHFVAGGRGVSEWTFSGTKRDGTRVEVAGCVLALEVRPLVGAGGDADPRQRADDALRPLRPVAGLVGVLDAQHERAVGLAGEDPVVERRARPTHVEVAGG